MTRVFRCDLHIHTCLSPCAELDMYPRSLVAQARAMNLDVIAICDHNSSENIPYVQKAAKGQMITVLPGMEITSSEEVHLLALFDSLELLTDLQDVIYTHLAGVNDEDLFGCQAIVNERDEVEGFNDHLLIGATDLPLKSLIDAIHERNGLAIASHIDREIFSVISQLGFIAEDMDFDALEISARMGMEEARRRFPELSHRTFVVSSDAHFVRDIGQVCTEVIMEAPTLGELKKAFGRQAGRFVRE